MSDLRLPLGKVCTKCGEWKLHEEFSFQSKAKGKRNPQCKACVTALVREIRERDPEKARAISRKSYHKNKERHKARRRAAGKRYYEANKERLKPIRRAWAEANREREAENRRRRYKQSPEQAKARHYRWIERKEHNGGSFTAYEWTNLCAEFDNRCACCGLEVKLTVDHVIPLSKGGANDIANIQPLCQPCNSRKHDRTIDYR